MPVKEIVDLPSNLVGKTATAIDNVIESGVREDFELRFSLLGREIGIRVEVMLLSKKPNQPTQ